MNRPDFESLSSLPLLAALVAGEAIGEPWLGKLGVAYSPINRAIRRKTTVREEILRHTTRKDGRVIWQYSCFGDPNRWGDMQDRAGRNLANECVRAAASAILAIDLDPTHGATHYYNPSIVTPNWATSLVETAMIGGHRFMKEKG